MKKKYILAIDQGTTGSRAIIFDAQCKVVASAYQEFTQYFPKPGWVEHDADEIWRSCVSVIEAAIKKSKISAADIASIGITNQRETTVMWDRKTSKPVARAIVWQCRRTAQICKSLKKHERTFRRKTGLVLDPYFSGTKIKWLLDNTKGLRARAQKGEICFGTIDSWLIWKLTGGKSHVTDYTNASRTLVFNIETRTWDAELLKILKIPPSILPKVQNSGSLFGVVQKPRSLQEKQITAVLGDQQAALYGQDCYGAGDVKNTYGTGCFLLLNTGTKLVRSKKGLLTTIASDQNGAPVYALEGAVFIGGAVVQWLRDQMKFFKNASESEKLIGGLQSNDEVYFVPAFAGLGAPHWNSDARGLISGLTRGTTPAQITRAALEAIAYQSKDVFDVMQNDLGRPIRTLKVDGGASANDFLMQFQSDLLNCKIVRPQMVETTALGVAKLSGVVVGLWKANSSPATLKKSNTTFAPKMTTVKRRQLNDGWQKAVERAQIV